MCLCRDAAEPAHPVCPVYSSRPCGRLSLGAGHRKSANTSGGTVRSCEQSEGGICSSSLDPVRDGCRHLLSSHGPAQVGCRVLAFLDNSRQRFFECSAGGMLTKVLEHS